ncbi:MAG: N-acetylmuramoyl-L-alanine amidase [Desulfuromonadaceae bacterium]
MKIIDHRLCTDDDIPVPYVPSPNVGGDVQHKFLIMHFTAGRSAEESVEWLASKNAKASAHVVIGRDGGITQLVPFDRVAWHAGASSWEGLQGMNNYSLGIELDNAGRLTRQGDRWRAWFGTYYDVADVMQAIHKFETDMCGWQVYTPEQIETALQVAGLLMTEYNLLDVVGHEDIAPHRKCDPGPAFPTSSFRSRLLGRSEDRTPLYKVITVLNIRSGPGTENPTIPGSPLPADTQVRFQAAEGTWWRVAVLAQNSIPNEFEGWVKSNYLERTAEIV